MLERAMNRTTTNLPVCSRAIHGSPVNYRFIFLNFTKPRLLDLGFLLQTTDVAGDEEEREVVYNRMDLFSTAGY